MRDLASHAIHADRTMRLDDLRWHVSRLTDAGLMNVRFRTLETEDVVGNIVRLPSSLWNPNKQPSNLGAIPWDEDVQDNGDKETDSRTDWGPTTISPPTSDKQSPTEYMSQDGQEENAPVILPVPDAAEPLSTPPKPGSDPVVMSLRSCIKGKSSRPHCFNYYTLDNHADICIFCNASLLTKIRPAEHRVSGISDTRISFDQVGDHPYCGTVIYAPKNKYNLIAMRVIKDNVHRYITDKDNTFIAIMDQNDRLLLKFNYDPLDKVRAEHAFDFLDPAKASKQSSESMVALPNALIDEAERTYDAYMFFTAEQRRRAALVPPIHVALNHPSDAALIEASNSPSLTNCPISAEDIANARVIYGKCKDCAKGKPYPLKGCNETLERQDIAAPGQLIHIDIVYVNGIPFLFSVDDFSGYMHMICMTNKSAVSLQGALLELILYYRGHLKVVQTISADHESTILACASYVNSHGATLRSRIPGEHEVDAERGIRAVRKSMRVKILELYKVPNAFLPWLAMDCTNTRNFIPYTRSSPRMPKEIVKGAKVNFRTDITASFGQLVLVKTNNVS